MNVLITGITGLLGTALVEERKSGIKIDGVYLGNYKMPDTADIKYTACDITDKQSFLNLLRDKNIDYIIHTAGIADTDLCEKEEEKAYVSNVIGTKNVIELAGAKNAGIVYISTNAIFDGKNAPYTETDSPNPINRYGALKLECENLVQKDSKRHLIIRPILLYGLNNPNERKSFFFWILEKLNKEEKINMVDDVFENPLLTYQCARFIWELIEKKAGGIYHLAGKDVLSRYDAAKVIAEVFSKDSSLVNPVPSSFFKDIAPRPKNTSYSTAKIEKELDEKPIGFQEGLCIVKKRMDTYSCRR